MAGLKPARKSLEGGDNLQEVKTACMVLNTTEYCLNTSLQLEERLKDKIDPKFREEISFQDQRETFSR